MIASELKSIIENKYKTTCIICYRNSFKDIGNDMIYFKLNDENLTISISFLLDGYNTTNMKQLEKLNIIGIDFTDNHFDKDFTNYIITVLKLDKI